MLDLYDSWRESPNIPAGWRPRAQPNALLKVAVKNQGALHALRAIVPGKWYKVYHYGMDGSAIHYFQHASGKVAAVKYKLAKP